MWYLQRLFLLSFWLDYKLKQLLLFAETHIKGISDLRSNIEKLGKVLKNERLVTEVAKSMYTNVHTEHGLTALRQFLMELEASQNLPPDFNIDMIIGAATLVTR